MAKKKPGFILYHEDIEIARTLTDEQLGRIVRLLYAYSVSGEKQRPSPELALAYALFEAKVQRDERAYEARCEKNRENVRRRWVADAEQTPNTTVYERIQSNTNGYETIRNDTKHTNGNGNGNGNGKYIIPPTTVNNNNTEYNTRARVIPDGCVVGECMELLRAAADDPFVLRDEDLLRALSLLAENYGPQPLYRATQKAIESGTPNVRDIRNILETWRQKDAARDAFEHEDVRRVMQ